MIRCAVFDFDGTLVMSNDIKREGFFAVTAEIAGGRAAMEALLADPPGDRYAIFAAFAARFGLDAGELAEAYGAWCEAAILAAHPSFNFSRVSFEKRLTLAEALFNDCGALDLREVTRVAENLFWLEQSGFQPKG